MEDAQAALREFSRELDDVYEMIDFSYNRTDLLTFVWRLARMRCWSEGRIRQPYSAEGQRVSVH